MKKGILAALLCALLLIMTGCNAVDEALGRLGDDIKASRLDTPEKTDSGIDWSYVPVVREMAVTMFTEAFPNATVTETSVASKNGDGKRVIVTLTYQMDNRNGTYGFDYTKNEQGEYELTRYGDGVNSDDL
ncbi:MAG: hypothetical protein SO155_04270 [Candidatus Ventricola sp.]|nr:hypothetical protein [Candidatus Ventricola sp.]